MSTLTEIDRNSKPFASAFLPGRGSGKKSGSKAPDHQPEPAPQERFELEDRVFSAKLRCWIKPVREIAQGRARPPETTRPVGDGSGVFWDTVDTSTGYRFWRIEARTFGLALSEKRRLCAAHGFVSGGYRLFRV